MPLHLRSFGGLALTREGSPTGLTDSRRKPLALLALVGAAGERGVSRDKLAGYLWAESDPERARGVLKQTLYVLRKEFEGGPELFLGTTDLRLNPDAITMDLWEFERLATAGDGAGAATCYTGHFLDGFHLSDAPEFERWVDEQRDRLARRMSALLERLALEASGRNLPREAADWWLRLTEHDPFDTRAVTGLLHALLQAGDRPRALRYAERHMALIRKELDITPDPEIRRLVEQARARPAGQPEACHQAEGGQQPARAPGDSGRDCNIWYHHDPHTVPLRKIQEHIMAERSRTRRNTLERRCLGKNWKRMFVGSPKSIFKILEAIKKI